ncbi:type IA DNA topoisomerase [Sphingobacterium bambusae]|uniref:DNA topoisomerase n=1 Tax=Sphingobacterium bambusae TaxID=662858 RepID=A0ABW6BCN6_9SPHI|nr:DNA topoisomerase [Sphingobacterium bambusae]WPL49155.1 DNA topoisomerase [Sphingobacterium bambusae]
MITILAEKPSVAREIARAVGATKNQDGYLSGNGYQVSWAIGHLIDLAMPEDYLTEGSSPTAELPIIPDPFTLRVRRTKDKKAYNDDPAASKQLKVIKKLFQTCESIIVATDAGREGELIFRYIYQYLESKTPFQRLWISSLTQKAIMDGLTNLQPGKNYDRLYHSAKARSEADWLIGINASRALSIAAAERAHSLGRVQTPTLALICKRHKEHEHFISSSCWQIELSHNKEGVAFKSLSIGQWKSRQEAQSTLTSLERKDSFLLVSKLDKKRMEEQPPLLFDLTGLQKQANKQLNLTAQETLDIAQKLYEKRFISYPRTSCEYIPEDLWPAIPGLILLLGQRESCSRASGTLRLERPNKRIVNSQKITDHHGLLITEVLPTALSAKENAVYDMIALRMLEALATLCVKEHSQVELQAANHAFIAKGSRMIQQGWRAVRGIFSEDDQPNESLPEFSEGDTLKIGESNLKEKRTKAPALYTEASLLTAMETAGKTLQTQNERKVLQQLGLGTASTRAAIMETLINRGYIERRKKAILPTNKGREIYEQIKDLLIASPEMTAKWELALQEIETGKMDAGEFAAQITDYTRQVTSELKAINLPDNQITDLSCPKCKIEKLHLNDRQIRCSSAACGWKQYRMICGVQLSPEDLKQLVTKNKTGLIKGLKGRSGKSFDAQLVLNDQAVSSFEFPRR